MENGNLTKLLWALNMKEASGKSKAKSRYEPNYYNQYLKGKKNWRLHLKIDPEQKWGKEAISSSYGPFQIMYPTAVQYGYKGSPADLEKPEVSLPYVQKYVNALSKKFNGNIEKIFSAYNAGEKGVGSNPEYTKEAMDHYKRAPSYWIAYGSKKITTGETFLAGVEGKPAELKIAVGAKG